MSEYRTVSTAAMLGTYEDFLKLYKKGDEKIEDSLGNSILYDTLVNSNYIARYKIAKFLINKGANIKSITKEGTTLFFPLFQRGGDDINGTTELCKIFLEKGADITALYKPYKIVVFKNIFNYFVDENEMIPLYKLIFSQPGLQLLIKDKWGLTALEFVKRCQKPIALKMMKDYIKTYNPKEDS
ncbi:ankyrin repeat-containing protein [Leptotrichia trevisanii]|uniref:ankyrin repeat domain-containing protein n=1 Tax=Leptotrichia trevisanii TaxID=109328 RepID=UPI00118A77CA|nr:ankyrin repeat domain-containing protein [Leptotrichia trevisanii]BBM56194.1 ankyrin repeat-containing protein [Leptotrichia trevisanii]